MRLAATLDAQSFSSYGGVGHFETDSSFAMRDFEISIGLLGVTYADCPKPMLLRLEEGDGVIYDAAGPRSVCERCIDVFW
jgi:hypothetical protein